MKLAHTGDHDNLLRYAELMLAEAGKVEGDAREAVLARVATRIQQEVALHVRVRDMTQPRKTWIEDLLQPEESEDKPEQGELEHGSGAETP